MLGDNIEDPGPKDLSEVNYLLLVSSRNSNSVPMFDGETGEELGIFVSTGSGGLQTTQEVQIGPDGNLYVTGLRNNAILRFDIETGEFLGNFTSGYSLSEPTKFVFGSDNLIYVSQWAGDQSVVRFDANTGEFIDQFTPKLGKPCGIAFKDGDVYISDFERRNVVRYDSLGEFKETYISPSDGNLRGPVNVFFRGKLFFVADWSTGSVKQYNSETGEYISDVITGMANVEGFAIGPDNRLYMCDWTNNTINRYNFDGSLVEVFVDSELSSPNSLVFIKTNN
jgi:streptogramin lyase